MAAALLSGLVCPGFGQWKNGERLKGALMVALTVALVLWIAVRIAWVALATMPPDLLPWEIERIAVIAHGLVHEHIGEFSGAIALLVVVWLGSVVDAWFGAVRASRR
jgi:hypothetical protein